MNQERGVKIFASWKINQLYQQRQMENMSTNRIHVYYVH